MKNKRKLLAVLLSILMIFAVVLPLSASSHVAVDTYDNEACVSCCSAYGLIVSSIEETVGFKTLHEFTTLRNQLFFEMYAEMVSSLERDELASFFRYDGATKDYFNMLSALVDVASQMAAEKVFGASNAQR